MGSEKGSAIGSRTPGRAGALGKLRPRTVAWVALIVWPMAIWSYVTWAGPVEDERVFAERRAEIERMDPAAKEQVRRSYERFSTLDRNEQERLRRLREEIEGDPNAADLRRVMHRYYQWLKTLSPTQRAELQSLPPSERVERIKTIKKQQADWESKRASWRRERLERMLQDPKNKILTTEDVGALFDWIEEMAPRYKDRFLETLPEERRQQWRRDLSKVTESSGQRHVLGLMWWRWQLDHQGELPPVGDEELRQLRQKLSEPARGKLESMPEDEQRKTIVGWIRLLLVQRYALEAMRRFGPPASMEQELADFLENLPANERGRLLSLSAEEMQRQLWYAYLRKKMPDVSLPGPYRPGWGRSRSRPGGFPPPRAGPRGPRDGPGPRGLRPPDSPRPEAAEGSREGPDAGRPPRPNDRPVPPM